jgi:hypothetical protein
VRLPLALVAVALAAGCADDLCARVDGSCIDLEVRGVGAVDQIVLDSVELGLSFARSPERALEASVLLPVRLPVRPLPHQGAFTLVVEGRLVGVPIGADTLVGAIFPGQHLKLIANLSQAASLDGGFDFSRPSDFAVARDLATPPDFAAPPDLLPSFHWVRDTSMSFPRLDTVWGTSPTNIYVAGSGGTIFHWNGSSWSPQSSGKSHVFEIHGADPAHILAACANGIVFSIGDGTWTPQFNGADILGIRDVTLSSQIAGGSSSFFMRSTGNGSWTNTTNPAGSEALDHFWSSSGFNIYAAGTSDSIWHSTNGTSFSPEATGSGALVGGIFGTSSTDVWALQDNSVLHSTGNGTWLRQTNGIPSTIQLWGIGGLPGDLYITGNSQEVYHSTGNGVWTKEATPPLAVDVGLEAVFVTGPNDVWVVGGGASSGTGVVLHKFVTP